MEGRKLSHYTVLERVGAGGMGVVYRARDERLHRDVALKLLPPETMADESARRRARAEAVLLSQLNHPNIATIHDIDHEGDLPFLVLEFLPGEGLDQRIARAPLAEAEAVRIGSEIADALAAAHARGVVHRDLKPGNVRLLPDGRVKVLDFGLARLSGSATSLAVTQSVAGEFVAGTMAYMPPEVLAGQPADERGDLYALGVVLYEMATGRRPFEAPNPGALVYAVLHQATPAARALRPEISPGYESLLLRAMDRDPARRPGSAAAFRAELESLAAGRGANGLDPPAVRSLVVLPLENLSGDPSQEFFSDGMTDALISGLAKIRGLRVISRTSAMRFKGTRKPLPEIAAELRVDAAVEGSIARSKDRVRVNAQLIHAATDALLWAESYERELSDVLALQAEVARAVAEEIRAAVQPGGQGPVDPAAARAPTATPSRPARRVDPAAFDLYLRGLQLWYRRTEDALLGAVECFDEAIRREPDWSLAHVGLAEAWGVIGFYGFAPPRVAFPKARVAAERALALDDTVGEAHTAMGYVQHYHGWQREEAERSYRRGLELTPGSALAHLWYTNVLASSARFEEARVQAREAAALDPLAPIMRIVPGWVSYFARDYELAAVEVSWARELDPSFWWSRIWTAWILIAMGRGKEAVAHVEDAIRQTEQPPEEVLAALALAAATAGETDRARAVLADLEAKAPRRFVSGYFSAMVHAALGEADAAFDCLDRAVAQRSHWLMWIDVDPRLDPLRGDPRFDALRREVGLAG